MSSLYTEFKLDNNFNSDDNIHKTQSLKSVLEPFSSRGNLDLLKRAGFKIFQVSSNMFALKEYLLLSK